MPLGLTRKRLDPGIADDTRPSMRLALPPVTRAMMFCTKPTPVKVAVSFTPTLKVAKLCSRLAPARWPRESGITKLRPTSVVRAPTDPSVAIWACAETAAKSRAAGSALLMGFMGAWQASLARKRGIGKRWTRGGYGSIIGAEERPQG